MVQPTSTGPNPERDVTKAYPLTQFADKLRRLADAVEGGERFRIQVAGERVSIPPDATISVEHERGEDGEEVEFQITWKSPILPESGEKTSAKGKAKGASGAKPRSKEG
jgi:amphi-Trp domain-containing protein